MSEVKTPLMPYRLEYICDACNSGKIYSTGLATAGYPPLYEHMCEQCGIKTKSRVSYPSVQYMELSDGQSES